MEEEKDRASDECVREREREKKGAREIDGGIGRGCSMQVDNSQREKNERLCRGGKLRTSMLAQQDGERWMSEYREWENEGSILIQSNGKKCIKHCLFVVVISYTLCFLCRGKTHKMAVAYRWLGFLHRIRGHTFNMRQKIFSSITTETI